MSLGSVDIITEDSEGMIWMVFADHAAVFDIAVLDPITQGITGLRQKFGDDLPFTITDIANNFLKSDDGTLFFYDLKARSIVSYHNSTGFHLEVVDVDRDIELVAIAEDGSIWANYAKTTEGFSTQVTGSNHYRDVVFRIDRSGRIIQEYPHDGYIGGASFFMVDEELHYYVEAPEGNGEFFKIDKTGKLHQQAGSLFDQLIGEGGRPQIMHIDNLKEAASIFIIEAGDLYIYDKQAERKISVNKQFPQFDIRTALGQRGYFVDQSERIWLGSDFGFYQIKVDRSLFTRILYKELDRSNGEKMGVATRAIIGGDDEIFVATEGTAIQRIPLRLGTPIANNAIEVEGINRWCWGLSELRNGQVLVGAYPYLSAYDPESERTRVIPEASQQDIGIWTMYEDRNGLIWLGDSWRGLFTLDLDKGIARPYDQLNGYDELALSTIMWIAEDQNGMIWMATSVGFYALDIRKGVTARYWSGGNGEFYLPAENFYHFHHDQDDIFWLATSERGLIRWDKKEGSYQSFTMSDGLPNNTIYGVYEDDYDRLWMSSDYGIARFDKSTQEVQSYLVEDGLTHNEFNRASHYQSEDGTIYFGGLNGVTSFDPKNLKSSIAESKSNLVITSFLQFDGQQNELKDRTADILKTNKIVIHPEDRYFQLSYALLSFQDMDQVSYAYQIEGFDKGWTDYNDNTLRLSRLPYGSFNLRIKARHPCGDWSDSQLNIGLIVVRPFYLSWWFFLILTTVLLSLLLWLYRHNINKNLAKAEVQRIKDIDDLKTRLYTYISHEFRTPLTVIMGMAGNIEGHNREKQLITRNSKNLLQLVGQLLDLSKLDATTITVRNKQGDIISYLRYLIQSFYSLAEERKIRLTFDSEIRSLTMDYDELKIQQIIYNLVSNAIKLTSDGGSVMIFTRKVSNHEEGALQIRVSDTGRGIPALELSKIFDRFYQVDETTDVDGLRSNVHHGGGTGIGLALTKELTELMGGSISVDSEYGKGSAFTILLPVTTIAEQSDHLLDDNLPLREKGPNAAMDGTQVSDERKEEIVTPEDESLMDKPQLLIIEDNRDVSEYVASCVDDSYHIHFAYDGQAGIEIALSVLPDIIISDVMMPIMDGYVVTTTLKNDPRTNHIPIILLTAKATIDSKVHGLGVGADAYLVKPFHKQELVIRLKKLVEIRKLLHEHYAYLISQNQDQSVELNDNERFVHNIHQLIVSRLDDHNLGASDLSIASDMSQGHMHRKLKALTGKTPALFIRSIRLERAVELLETGEYNVSEVAYRVGFSDPNYFSRIFSAEFGKSPSLYINN